jgi:thioesterase domain-containing protein
MKRKHSAASSNLQIELERYLHDHIPLSKAMSVSVVAVDEKGVTLQAPLAPNINHRETVFGGSASALAILAAWSLLHTRLQLCGIACRLVIQRNTMEYDLPVAGAFSAESMLMRPVDWDRFIKILKRRGRARISVAATLRFDDQTVGRFTGDYVAIRNMSG